MRILEVIQDILSYLAIACGLAMAGFGAYGMFMSLKMMFDNRVLLG